MSRKEVTEEQVVRMSIDLEYAFTKAHEKTAELMKDLIEADEKQRPILLEKVKKVQDRIDLTLFQATQAEELSRQLGVRK